jgi:hypothetical protein
MIKTKYKNNFIKKLNIFEFKFEELTKEILIDFSGWKMETFTENSNELYVSFINE